MQTSGSPSGTPCLLPGFKAWVAALFRPALVIDPAPGLLLLRGTNTTPRAALHCVSEHHHVFYRHLQRHAQGPSSERVLGESVPGVEYPETEAGIGTE